MLLTGLQAVEGGVPGAAEAVLARRDAFASHRPDEDQAQWLTAAGISLVRGHARIATVAVAGEVPLDVSFPTGQRSVVAVVGVVPPALIA